MDHDAAYMELVELEDGDVVLRRVDDQKILIQISFGDVGGKYFPLGKMEIARAMMYAGFKTFNKIAARMADEHEHEDSASSQASDSDDKKTSVTQKSNSTRVSGNMDGQDALAQLDDTATTVH